MSICNPCTKMVSVVACPGVLTIGTISSNNTDVFVYFKNHTTGRLDKYDVTSSAGGVVRIDFSEGNIFMQGHDYEVFVTLADATDLNARETITIGATGYTCLAVEFARAFDFTGDPLSLDQTLTPEA